MQSIHASFIFPALAVQLSLQRIPYVDMTAYRQLGLHLQRVLVAAGSMQYCWTSFQHTKGRLTCSYAGKFFEN